MGRKTSKQKKYQVQVKLHLRKSKESRLTIVKEANGRVEGMRLKASRAQIMSKPHG